MILPLALVTAMLPLGVAAEDTVQYLAYSEEKGLYETELTGGYTEITNDSTSSTSWNAGWYVVTGNNVTIDQRVTVAGAVVETQVTLPSSTVEDLGKETDADLTISTPVAEATLPNTGLEGLGSQGGKVTVTTTAKDNIRTLEITAGGKPMATENGITIPLDGSATVEIIDNAKTFTDVSGGYRGEDAIGFTSSHQLFNGTSETIFDSEAGMDRATMAQVFHNLEDNPAASSASDFTDVPVGQCYNEAIAWAQETGVVGGMGDGTFQPEKLLTREEVTQMFYNYATAFGLDTTVGSGDKLAQFSDEDQVTNVTARFVQLFFGTTR